MRAIFILAWFLLVSACAGTPYQKMGVGGGYDDRKVTDTLWSVKFISNVKSARGFAQEAALYRSAEIAKAKGFKFFAVVSSNVHFNQHGSYAGGSLIFMTTTGQTATIDAVGLQNRDSSFACASATADSCGVFETDAVLRDHAEVMRKAGHR